MVRFKTMRVVRRLAILGWGMAAVSSAILTDVSVTTMPAEASVQKVLFVCVHGRKKEICPQFRPSFKVPEGFIEDRTAEAKQGRVIYVPRGKTYETAALIITTLTTLNKSKTSIETLTERGNAAFKLANKDATIQPLAPVESDKLGGPVKLFKVFTPDAKPRPYEITARFADKDADGAPYVVELALAAMTERGLIEGRPKFEAMIKGY